jgi:hypothetical protein
MIRASGTVVLDDGSRHEFASGLRDFSAWERYALANGLPPLQNAVGNSALITLSAFLAYSVITRGQAERPGFDAWMDTVVDLVGLEYDTGDPTQAAVSATSSPALPPERESPNGIFGTPSPEISLPSQRF